MSPELERYSVAISTSRCLLLISCDLKCMFFICASFGFRGIPMCIYIFSRLLFSRKRERSLFLYFLFIHTFSLLSPELDDYSKGQVGMFFVLRAYFKNNQTTKQVNNSIWTNRKQVKFCFYLPIGPNTVYCLFLAGRGKGLL